MRSTGIALAMALSIGLVATAHAGTYSTPILYHNSGNPVDCYVTNVGTTPIRFAVTLYNDAGGVVTPTFDFCLGDTLPAGATCRVNLTAGGFTRCTVEASSSKVRANMVIYDGASNIIGSAVATKK